jgi:hypothetical protein
MGESSSREFPPLPFHEGKAPRTLFVEGATRAPVIEGFNDILEGDTMEFYVESEEKQTL